MEAFPVGVPRRLRLDQLGSTLDDLKGCCDFGASCIEVDTLPPQTEDLASPQSDTGGQRERDEEACPGGFPSRPVLPWPSQDREHRTLRSRWLDGGRRFVLRSIHLVVAR